MIKKYIAREEHEENKLYIVSKEDVEEYVYTDDKVWFRINKDDKIEDLRKKYENDELIFANQYIEKREGEEWIYDAETQEKFDIQKEGIFSKCIFFWDGSNHSRIFIEDYLEEITIIKEELEDGDIYKLYLEDGNIIRTYKEYVEQVVEIVE